MAPQMESALKLITPDPLDLGTPTLKLIGSVLNLPIGEIIAKYSNQTQRVVIKGRDFCQNILLLDTAMRAASRQDESNLA